MRTPRAVVFSLSLAVAAAMLAPAVVAAAPGEPAGSPAVAGAAVPTWAASSADWLGRAARAARKTSPVAETQSIFMEMHSVQRIILTGHDADGDRLTFAIVDRPDHGRLGAIVRINRTSARVTYTPEDTFTGTDSFTFVASDGAFTSSPALVSITVAGANTTIQTVDAETGGVVQVDNEIRLEFQPGALEEDAIVIITVEEPEPNVEPEANVAIVNPTHVSNIWNIQVVSVTTGDPVQFSEVWLTGWYDESRVPSEEDEPYIQFAYQDQTGWNTILTEVDFYENVAFATSDHLSRWSLVV
jgi:hypothetical protein